MRKRLAATLKSKRGRMMIILLLEGIILRFLIATQGHTVDFDAYRIVADLVQSGGQLYADTTRYNYSPVWAYLLVMFKYLADFVQEPVVFRVLLVGLLTAGDMFIAWFLYRRFGLKAFALYWFNPLTIIGAGYFMQFDVLAIAVILLALRYKDHTVSFGILLGLSLAVKHLFIFLPLWLFLRRDGIRKYWRPVLIAYAVFALSFLPVLSQWQYVYRNVFAYSANDFGIFQNLFVPEVFGFFLSPQLIFVLCMLLAGFLLRKKSLLTMMLWYTVVLVIVSPAMLHTYLIIPAIALAVYPNLIFLAYSVVVTYLFTLDGMGIGLSFFVRTAPDFMLENKVHDDIYLLPVLLLTAGMIISLWGRQLFAAATGFAKAARTEIKLQWQQLNDYSSTR